MDSQERHELKQNDLYEFLTHFKQWWNKHGTSTLLLICAVVAGYVAVNYFRTRDIRFNEQAWGALAVAQTPEALAAVAEQYPDTTVALQAYLNAGDLLLHRAVFGQSDPQHPDQPPVPLPPDQLKDNLERAARFYQLVIQAGHGQELPNLLVLNARMGLAAVYESLNEFDKAAEQYRKIQAEAGPYQLFAVKAQQMLARLDELAKPVIFPPQADLKAAQAQADSSTPPAPPLPQPDLGHLPKLPNPLAPETSNPPNDPDSSPSSQPSDSTGPAPPASDQPAP